MSRFDTDFGMIHSLATFEAECVTIVMDCRQRVANVTLGLRSGSLTVDVATRILDEVNQDLEKLAK